MSATETAPRPLAPGIHPGVERASITRDKLYFEPGSRSYGPQWQWIYSVSIDGSDPVTHGTGLRDCESVVRRKYPNAVLRRAWKALA